VDLEYGERSRAPEYGSPAPATPAGYEYPAGDREAAGSPNPTGEDRRYEEAESREGARVYDWDIGTERRETGGSRSGAGTTDSDGSRTVGPGMSMGDTETGEFREHDRNREGLSQPGSDLEDEDELRVQRSEEELVAGTREREAGSVNVRKRVRIDRERVEVPTRREEVSVERVPASGDASEAQIGAEEVSVPVVEDEVVVQKKPVVKEEIRLRKDVVHERQVVEEDVRREEVNIEDDTRRRRG
jgi:uncharacterized protein (TIGR02271 family)